MKRNTAILANQETQRNKEEEYGLGKNERETEIRESNYIQDKATSNTLYQFQKLFWSYFNFSGRRRESVPLTEKQPIWNCISAMQSVELSYETRQTDRQAFQNNRHPIEQTVNTTNIKIRQQQDAISDNNILRVLSFLEESIQNNGFSACQDIITVLHVQGSNQTTEQLRAEICSKCQPKFLGFLQSLLRTELQGHVRETMQL